MEDIRLSLPNNSAQVRSEIERLLKVRLEIGGRDFASPIGKVVRAAYSYHSDAQRALLAGHFAAARQLFLNRDLEYARARYFLLDLRRLEQANPSALRSFVKRFKRARSVDNFYGLRFELKVASMLILKKMQFTQPEPPDFRIDFEGVSVAFECGSVRISKQKPTDLTYKVLGEIAGKSKKPYANKATALLIDATNLFKNGWVPGGVYGFELPAHVHEALLQELKGQILFKLDETKLGSVLVYMTQYDADLRILESNYIRIDSSGIDESLAKVLNAFAPFERKYVKHAIAGAEG